MSLQGIAIPPGQKIPGAIVEDLRRYANALGLPKDWHKRITLFTHPATATVTPLTRWDVDYEGRPFANYELDCLQEIESKIHHVPIPDPVDPLVVATELAMSQPADTQWRRFKHLTFQRAEVAYVNNVDKAGCENSESFEICFRNGTKLVCGNQKNYANSGMSTCEFFIEHVLELRSQNADRCCNR